MRTLDEVITGMTELILSGKTADVKSTVRDALHYLKEFQGLSKMWNDKLDKEQENPPLTWDELKGMEGKPVWIEELDYSKRWYGFWDVVSDAEDYGDEKMVYTNSEMRYEMAEYGTTWQAYRKERHEG